MSELGDLYSRVEGAMRPDSRHLLREYRDAYAHALAEMIREDLGPVFGEAADLIDSETTE